jgi:acetyltransferase-like isoleucine patch superfamily enzyme
MAFLDPRSLRGLGLNSFGQNVLISEKATIYGAERIIIGDNVRIDDFCILSAGENGIQIGSYIHIACYTSLIGREAIRIDDFANLSARVAVYSSSDDYSGDFMTNPIVPTDFTNVDHRPVYIGRHCIVGSGTVILPGVSMDEGSAVGSLSLVTKSCLAFCIYGGVPARFLKKRSAKLLVLESDMRSQIKK